jgi:hypothetical protein
MLWGGNGARRRGRSPVKIGEKENQEENQGADLQSRRRSKEIRLDSLKSRNPKKERPRTSQKI